MQLREVHILRIAVCLLALQLAASAARLTSEPSDQSSMSPASNFNTKSARLNRFENLESDFWERRKLNTKKSKPDASLKWTSASANVQQLPVSSKTGHEPVSVLEKEKEVEKVSKATQKSESEVKFVQPKHRAGWLMPDEDNNAIHGQ